jgi:hypothetical protein
MLNHHRARTTTIPFVVFQRATSPGAEHWDVECYPDGSGANGPAVGVNMLRNKSAPLLKRSHNRAHLVCSSITRLPSRNLIGIAEPATVPKQPLTHGATSNSSAGLQTPSVIFGSGAENWSCGEDFRRLPVAGKGGRQSDPWYVPR